MDKLSYSIKKGGSTLELTGNFTPGAIVPGEEILRNSERALNGAMTVDVVGSKKKFDLAWTLLHNTDYLKLTGVLQSSSVVKLIELATTKNSSGNVDSKTTEFTCVVDSVSAKPVVYGDLYWQDVAVKLLEK